MTTFNRIARTVSEPFEVPYAYLVTLGVGALLLWIAEWIINLFGGGAFNTFATILTSVAIVVIGMKPLLVAYSGQIGAALAVLSLKDPRNAVAQAVRTHLKVVLWLTFANIIVGLTLGNIPFGNPFGNAAMVFPNLLLLAGAAILFGYLFDIDGVGLKKKFIGGFLVLILGILAWHWVGPENRASAVESISNLDIDLDGSNCSLNTPCVATVGYVLTLTEDRPLTFRLSNGLEDTGLEVKVTDPELRATVHDSELFKVTQQLGTQIFTITAEPGFADLVEDGRLVLKLYPNGQGDKMVRQDYGVFTPAIDFTPAE